jgi:hypothetical protein
LAGYRIVNPQSEIEASNDARACIVVPDQAWRPRNIRAPSASIDAKLDPFARHIRFGSAIAY